MLKRPLQRLAARSARLYSRFPMPNALQASFLRGGTSKGLFIKRTDLPADRRAWAPILLRAMGSPDAEYGRQLDGMGGGVSSLSKVCVVGAPRPEEVKDSANMKADVEYTFVQVGIREPELDFSGNCGNLSSMIGVFAVEEGLCVPRLVTVGGGPGEAQPWGRATAESDVDDGGEGTTAPATLRRGVVRAYNTNTEKYVDTTFPVVRTREGGYAAVLDLPEVEMAGVPRRASRIDLDFVAPAGARTGRLLPTGAPVDVLAFAFEGSEYSIKASLVDATNPTAFITSEDLSNVLGVDGPGALVYAERRVEDCVEVVRQAGARAMGLDPAAKAQPKIAVLSAPSADADTNTDTDADIVVHAFSMGVLHKAVPMTLGLCLGVAARTAGTIAHTLLPAAHRVVATGGDLVRIRHPSGVVEVGAVFGEDGEVQSAKVVRTGRRLMKGVVYY